MRTTVLALNNISRKGLDLFPVERYAIIEHRGEGPLPPATALVLRSADLRDMGRWQPSQALAVARAGAGTNNIPVAELSEGGVVVFNTPGENANSVKELVIAALVMASRNIGAALHKVDDILITGGDVLKAAETAKKPFAGTEIKGKTLGVVGLGQIGVLVANAAHDLGMHVIGYDTAISVEHAWHIHDGVRRANTFDELLRQADVLSLHVPFNDQTRHLLRVASISRLKPGAIVLNFARNGVVDDDAMLQALHQGICRAYVTDFLSAAYAGMSNVIQLPHLGASTEESEERCAIAAVKEVRDYLEQGVIINAVNFPNMQASGHPGTRILILHRNVPSVIARLTQVLGSRGINIGRMQNDNKGDYAATLVEVDLGVVSAEAIQLLGAQEDVLRVRVFSA